MSEKPLSERLRIAALTAEAGQYPTASMLMGWAEEAEQLEASLRELREWLPSARTAQRLTQVDED